MNRITGFRAQGACPPVHVEKNVSSGSFMNSRYGGDVTNYFSSDGRGIRFNKEGDFIGFIEKNIIGNE